VRGQAFLGNQSCWNSKGGSSSCLGHWPGQLTDAAQQPCRRMSGSRSIQAQERCRWRRHPGDGERLNWPWPELKTTRPARLTETLIILSPTTFVSRRIDFARHNDGVRVSGMGFPSFDWRRASPAGARLCQAAPVAEQMICPAARRLERGSRVCINAGARCGPRSVPAQAFATAAKKEAQPSAWCSCHRSSSPISGERRPAVGSTGAMARRGCRVPGQVVCYSPTRERPALEKGSRRAACGRAEGCWQNCVRCTTWGGSDEPESTAWGRCL